MNIKYIIIYIIVFCIIVKLFLEVYSQNIPNKIAYTPFIIKNTRDENNYFKSTQYLTYKLRTDHIKFQTKNSSDIRIYKKNSNTYRDKHITHKNRINFNNLNNVNLINLSENYADVEASTTFETYVNELLKFGYIPTVTPELKSITVGGAIVGIGIEASSFKFGLVHESMINAEILLSSGKIVVCDINNYPDLFYALPNSLGSLGYILKIRMKIIPCKKYVYLKKITCNHGNVVDIIKENWYNNKKMDFIEGVAYKNKMAVVMVGYMTNNKIITPNKYDCSKIFYKTLLNNKDDLLPIKYYIWRWDTDMFWTTLKVDILRNKLIRLYLGKNFLRSDVLRKISNNKFYSILNNIFNKNGNKNKEMFIQDIIVPLNNSKKWIDFHFKNILKFDDNSVPLWLCPTLPSPRTLLPTGNKLYINFGYWSDVRWLDKSVTLNEYVEKNLDKFNAMKSLYSHVYFKKEIFYNIYNGLDYFVIKKKYDRANKIRGMYEKCTQK